MSTGLFISRTAGNGRNFRLRKTGRRPAGPPVWIHICCNDPDTGAFGGRVAGISVNDGGGIDKGGTLLELEPRGAEPRFTLLGGRFRLAGKTWMSAASKDWVGNWCWNAYAMPREAAADFFIWLHGRQLFCCTAAMEPLIDFWERTSLTPADRGTLLRALAEVPT